MYIERKPQHEKTRIFARRYKEPFIFALNFRLRFFKLFAFLCEVRYKRVIRVAQVKTEALKNILARVQVILFL